MGNRRIIMGKLLISSCTKKLILLFMIALIVRIIWLLFVVGDYHHYGEISLSSADAAHNIIAGYGYATDHDYVKKGYQLQEERKKIIDIEHIPRLGNRKITPNFKRPPGYAIILAATFKLFGKERYIYSRIFQIILDSLGCVILYLLVHLIFSSHIALLSAFLYSLFPPFVANSVRTMPDAYIPFFTICSIYLLMKALQGKQWNYFFLSGIIMGIACYFRPDIILFPLFCSFGIICYQKSAIIGLLNSGILIFSMLIMLVPWGIRNYNLTGKLILTSTSAGVTLWEGIGEFPNKWGAVCNDIEMNKLAVSLGFDGAWTPEADSYFKKRWWAVIKEDPIFYLMGIMRRMPSSLVVNWSWGTERWFDFDIISLKAFKKNGGNLIGYIKKHPFMFVKILLRRTFQKFRLGLSLIIILLTLTGIWKVRKDLKRVVILLLVPLYFILSHITTHFEPRYILPCAISYLIFSSVALDFLFQIIYGCGPGNQPKSVRSIDN